MAKKSPKYPVTVTVATPEGVVTMEWKLSTKQLARAGGALRKTVGKPHTLHAVQGSK